MKNMFEELFETTCKDCSCCSYGRPCVQGEGDLINDFNLAACLYQDRALVIICKHDKRYRKFRTLVSQFQNGN
jgi:hypothetical protein